MADEYGSVIESTDTNMITDEDASATAAEETFAEAVVDAAGGDEPPVKKTRLEDTSEESSALPENDMGTEEETDTTKRKSPELEKFWKAVKDDPKDFTGWTYLLQFVDSNGELEDAREAFDAFLMRYPYCYGYWKKYADLEKKKESGVDTVVEVFERGVVAIPLSCDLWIHYLNYARETFAEDEERIRQLYERAVEACGREWRSDKMWDHYVKWEVSLEEGKEMKNYQRVVRLYDQILLNPTQGLSHQFDMFREFVKDKDPKELLNDQDFLALRKEVLLAIAGNGNTDDVPADEVPEDGLAPAVEMSETGVEPTTRLDEEQLTMREKIIQSRRKIFKSTEAKVAERSKFEDNIKRPYFHIKPLERAQLKNWSDYLEFEMKQDDPSLTEFLFERCLIACAHYQDYWIKFANWQMDRLKQEEDDEQRQLIVAKIRHVFTRACTHHVPDKVDVFLAWSAFEETQGDYDAAINVLDKVEAIHPKLAIVNVRRINCERRRGNIEAVHSLYRSCIDSSSKPSDRSAWSIKYARFLRFVVADEVDAIRVLEDALLVDAANARLYLQLIDIHLHRRIGGKLDVAKILAVMDTALDTSDKSKSLSESDRTLFLQRKADFLEEFGEDVSVAMAARTAYDQSNSKLKTSSSRSDGYQNSGSSSHDARPTNGAGVTTYEATNSTSYAAHHTSQYQQYGARYGGYSGYNQYPTNYYSGGGYNY